MARNFTLFGGLPGLCALVPVVWCLSYAASMLVAGAGTGRQSSTTGIAIGLAIIAAPLLGATGLGLGRLITLFVNPTHPGRWKRTVRWCATLVLAAVAAVASLQASGPMLAAEREAAPRMIIDSLPLTRRIADRSADSVTRASRVYDSVGKVNEAIAWEAGSRPALVLLITGRATGRRDLLAVISGSRQLVYRELLERTWDFRSVPLAIAPSAAGDQILIGPELVLTAIPR